MCPGEKSLPPVTVGLHVSGYVPGESRTGSFGVCDFKATDFIKGVFHPPGQTRNSAFKVIFFTC